MKTARYANFTCAIFRLGITRTGYLAMADAPFHIERVRSRLDLQATIDLFRTYAASLPIDLGYQDFEGEMATMPGKYAPPSGELFLALDPANEPIGCVALRSLGTDRCEMKRLYVSDAGRGLGLGRALAEAVIATAEAIGYREIVLDTLPSMVSAQALYRKLGFQTISAYYDSPIAGTTFLRRSLAQPEQQKT